MAERQAAQANSRVLIRSLGAQDYTPVWHAMRRFTDLRTAETADEIWFTEHGPVFTLGLNAAPEHLLAPGDVPVVHVDRGGQVTYHGPGQLLIYPLIDIRRAGLGVRDVVTALELSVVDLLAGKRIEARRRADAPGVYVDDRKVASVGLRIRRGASYHGMALNVDMDLEPFSRINPCGYRNLEVIDLAALGVGSSVAGARDELLGILLERLGMAGRAVHSAGGELPVQGLETVGRADVFP